MILKTLETIAESDIAALISNGVAESRQIEYKRDLPGNADGDKKEFLADVSSFANTNGGDIIYGLEETQGVPTAIVPLQLADPDLEIRRLDGIISQGLEPRIRHHIRVIAIANGGYVIVIRAERSWMGPHRVIFKSHDKFYGRRSAGKYSLEVSELRESFGASIGVTDKLRSLRAERLLSLQSDPPIDFIQGPKVVVHCIPLQSLTERSNYDVLRIAESAQKIPILSGTLHDWRINFDGLLGYAGPGTAYSYTQLFRSGVIESVSGTLLPAGNQSSRFIPHIGVEQRTLQHVKRCLGLLTLLGVATPIAISLTLLGVKGFRIQANQWADPGHAIKQQDLLLPEAILQEFNQSLPKLLKPIFDLVWNASGIYGSVNFDADGNWTQQQYPLGF